MKYGFIYPASYTPKLMFHHSFLMEYFNCSILLIKLAQVHLIILHQ